MYTAAAYIPSAFNVQERRARTYETGTTVGKKGGGSVMEREGDKLEDNVKRYTVLCCTGHQSPAISHRYLHEAAT